LQVLRPGRKPELDDLDDADRDGLAEREQRPSTGDQRNRERDLHEILGGDVR